MLKKLNFCNFQKNKDGFASIVTLIIMPLMATLLSVVSGVVIITSFKREFRFICLNESLALQKQLLNILNTKQINSFNIIAKNGSALIAHKLKNIKSAIEYKNLKVMYPKIELHRPDPEVYRLAFNLEYSFIKTYSIECGTKLLKENNKWKNEIIY